VHELPAELAAGAALVAPVLAAAVAGDSIAGARDPSQFLDVEVD
jgi:hypothetical protein